MDSFYCCRVCRNVIQSHNIYATARLLSADPLHSCGTSFYRMDKKLQHKDRAVVSSILGVLIVISFFVTNPWFPSLVQTDLINYNGDEFEQIISTTKSLTKNNPEAKIFSFVPYFGMKAGGKIFPGTEYGITSLAIGWDR